MVLRWPFLVDRVLKVEIQLLSASLVGNPRLIVLACVYEDKMRVIQPVFLQLHT